MGGYFIPFVLMGAAAVYLDVWVTQGLFGFENPYCVIALCVISVLALLGSFRDGRLPAIIMMIVGIVTGVLATNYLRTSYFDQPSVLIGVGL